MKRVLFVIMVMVLFVGAIIFVAPLVHIEFPKQNSSLITLKDGLEKKVVRFDIQISGLRQQYIEGEINASDYISTLDQILLERTELLKSNEKILKDKIDSDRIFGWKTLRVFLVGFGVWLPYLLFSLIISFLIYKVNTKDENLMKAFLVLQILCYAISFYVLIWCFWYSQDYPLKTYRLVILIISFLLALFSTYTVRYYNSSNIQVLKLKIR